MSKRKTKVREAPSPEAVAVINTWRKFAQENHLVFSPWIDVPFKSQVVVDTNHCPCKNTRVCPCEWCIDEVKIWGTCWCRIFCSMDYVTNPDKYSHETFEQSEEIMNVKNRNTI